MSPIKYVYRLSKLFKDIVYFQNWHEIPHFNVQYPILVWSRSNILTYDVMYLRKWAANRPTAHPSAEIEATLWSD